jgi:hypothetical protein
MASFFKCLTDLKGKTNFYRKHWAVLGPLLH